MPRAIRLGWGVPTHSEVYMRKLLEPQSVSAITALIAIVLSICSNCSDSQTSRDLPITLPSLPKPWITTKKSLFPLPFLSEFFGLSNWRLDPLAPLYQIAFQKMQRRKRFDRRRHCTRWLLRRNGTLSLSSYALSQRGRPLACMCHLFHLFSILRPDNKTNRCVVITPQSTLSRFANGFPICPLIRISIGRHILNFASI